MHAAMRRIMLHPAVIVIQRNHSKAAAHPLDKLAHRQLVDDDHQEQNPPLRSWPNCYSRCNLPKHVAGSFKKAGARQRHYIKRWREYRKLTQDKLVEMTGMSKATISRIENGRSPYTQDTLEALAEALGATPAELLTRDPYDPEGIWGVWDRLRGNPQALNFIKTISGAA
jgi:DNA-binding Xre family transcriptional regulator